MTQMTFRSNPDGVTAFEFNRWQQGEATSEQILRERLEERHQPPPTPDDIAAFQKSLDDLVNKMSQSAALMASRASAQINDVLRGVDFRAFPSVQTDLGPFPTPRRPWQ